MLPKTGSTDVSSRVLLVTSRNAVLDHYALETFHIVTLYALEYKELEIVSQRL